MSKAFSRTTGQNFGVSFSSTIFVLTRFRVVLSDGSFKTLQQMFCKKSRLEKFLQRNRQKNPKPVFLDWFISRFWAFPGEGCQKHHAKNITNYTSDPGPFQFVGR
jgi:hypothetical protein